MISLPAYEKVGNDWVCRFPGETLFGQGATKDEARKEWLRKMDDVTRIELENDKVPS